ncbi:Phenol hydroxylase [Fulvia fulva]|uniref:Phenol hydroxylase n=1 Tax=Passalora fulva TaxID=5499 RepID=A0A9Q8P920_PASFU|nr:Phenol hydroxylase [Fulvia fulva]KAK4624479.1 Phenol hydroxylase [Fulvia fulva]KAK4625700.1 Phenol hydroxylase [Fulvia fulva]UJO17597.1 Phenol hydroxylase [Fulvia fulva]WPV15636.1 Phenol hydroxylase [Fulvia fulva]WPV29557.1 Phenol hydroxylase [Fulvia fulva]
MTQEQAVHEAKLAVAPFELEFVTVGWHKVYGIQQRVAERLVDRENIILAGDTAHTHSSGTAQGMDVGMHDVVSLGWRLAGVLKGWYPQAVLVNYSDERKAVAQQLIDNDKVISTLISGQKPESMQDRPEDVMTLMNEFMDKTGDFGLGLGVKYPRVNLLNDGDHAYAGVKIFPGNRALDALFARPGFRRQNVRLHEVPKNNGKFKVMVFVGKPDMTRSALSGLRAQVDKYKDRHAHAVDFLTIIKGLGLAFDEPLGMRKFGNAFWDIDSSAHWTYGIADFDGAVVVLRPDGIIGASAPLRGYEEVVVPYFDRLMLARASVKQAQTIDQRHIGELHVLNPFENSLTHSRKNVEVST